MPVLLKFVRANPKRALWTINPRIQNCNEKWNRDMSKTLAKSNLKCFMKIWNFGAYFKLKKVNPETNTLDQ